MSNSFVLRSKSFRNVSDKTPKLPVSKTIADHNWIYNKNDLQYICQDWQDQKVVVGRLAEVGGKQGLEYALRTDLKRGLYQDEVDDTKGDDEWGHKFPERKDRYGINEFTKQPATHFCMLVYGQLQDPFLLILIFAAFVNIFIGIYLMGECPQNTPEYIDGLAILIAVSLVVFVGSYQDYSQEKQFRAKEDETAEKVTVVMRGRNQDGEGVEEEINQKHVMVGDIVILKTGSTIPADGIYIHGTEDFKITEAAMTGETLPLAKSHSQPLILGGTQVVAGEGVMLCVCVGDDTQWGLIMGRIQNDPEETPLQVELDGMAKRIGYGGMAAAFILFCVLLIKWGVDTPAGQHAWDADTKIPSFLILAVTIIVVAVPEGLPLAVTISLSYSMKRMMADNNFVRHLAACETMSNATTICSDKTGTLTLNKMTVSKASIGNKFYDTTPGPGDLQKEVEKKVTIGLAVNSKAFEAPIENQELFDKYGPEFTGGNATEYALLKWSMWNLKCDYLAERKRHIVEKAYPFSSVVKRSSILIKEPGARDDEYVMYLKGAAEVVLKMCNRILRPDGQVGDYSEADQDQTRAHIQRMANTGLRCVGFAWRVYEERDFERSDAGMPKDVAFEDYVWIGVAGIKDPVRDEVPAAVADAQKAGVIVRMVTGDHLDTAKYIARECGIYTSKNHVCMTGAQYRALTEKEMEDKLPRLRVMARSQPVDKENLVRWYKRHGHIVAVTGDGANDALALKEANVGLAMGIQGTDVAKEAADIIIMDDNFKSIVASVTWGRCVYDNIRKFLQFQLTVNVVACVVSLIAAFMDEIQMDAVLTPIQLLWVNLIMDTMAALALGTERPSKALLDRFPFRQEAGLISPVMKRFILGHSFYQMLWLFIWIFFGWRWFHFGELDAYPGVGEADVDCTWDKDDHACKYNAAACAYSSNPPMFFDGDYYTGAAHDMNSKALTPLNPECFGTPTTPTTTNPTCATFIGDACTKADGCKLGTKGSQPENMMCAGSKHRHCSEASAAGKVCNNKCADLLSEGMPKAERAKHLAACCKSDGCQQTSSIQAKTRNIVPCTGAESCSDNYTEAECAAESSCMWKIPDKYSAGASEGEVFTDQCVYPPRCDHAAIRCVMAHKSMAFNIFIWCQIFNEINARKVNGEWNIFENFFTNPMYSIIVLITIVTQVVLIEVFGAVTSLQAVFNTTPATWDMWLVTIAIGAGSILWNFCLNLIPLDKYEKAMQVVIGPEVFAQDLEALNVEVDTKEDGNTKTEKVEWT